MKTSITFDDAIWKQKIKKLAARAKVDEKKFVKENGGLMVRDIAKFTPPYANFPTGKGRKVGTKKDQIAGELAVEYDLKKIFFVPDDESIIDWAESSFSGAIYEGNKVIGAGVARTLGDVKRHHMANQNNRTGRTRKIAKSQKMWVRRKLFFEYLLREKSSVGRAKAAVLSAAVKIDRKRAGDAPKWVARHLRGGRSSGRMGKIKNGWNALFSASAPGLQHVHRAEILARVRNSRAKAMEKQLASIMAHNAKKSRL